MIDARPHLTPGTSYYDVVDSSGLTNLAGSLRCYPEPCEAISEIARRVAFNADGFDINVE
jgi:hypothetical protein